MAIGDWEVTWWKNYYDKPIRQHRQAYEDLLEQNRKLENVLGEARKYFGEKAWSDFEESLK